MSQASTARISCSFASGSAASAAPYAIGMSGPGYLAAAALLGAVFLGHSIALCRRYSDALARRTFRWSIVYLTLLFAALLVDHFAQLR